MTVLGRQEISAGLILEPASLLHEAVLIQMILLILPAYPAGTLHSVVGIEHLLIPAVRKSVRNDDRRIILKLIIHVHSGRNPRHTAVGRILPEGSAVILQGVRILRHPLVVFDISDLILEHILAGVDHRIISVRLHRRTKRIDQRLQLLLRHILMTGILNIIYYRIIYRIITDPLHEKIRLVLRLLHGSRVRIQIHARPQSCRAGTPHIDIEIRIHSRIRTARLHKGKTHPGRRHLAPVDRQIMFGDINPPCNGTSCTDRLHLLYRCQHQSRCRTQCGHTFHISFCRNFQLSHLYHPSVVPLYLL